MLAAREHNDMPNAVGLIPPAQYIHHGFRRPVGDGQQIQQPQGIALGGSLSRGLNSEQTASQGIHIADKALVAVGQHLGRGMRQLVAQRHLALGASLEMSMVGSRSSALRSVIEHDKIGQVLGQRQHVPHPVRNALRLMAQVGYREVTLEDGIRIDLNLVMVTPQHGLLLNGLVLTAQETLAACKRLPVDGGGR